jgi:hypothetical protein
MSGTPPVTVRAAFDNLKPDSSRVTLAADEVVGPAVKAHIGAVEWTASAAVLLPKVAELLDIRLSRIFVAFWQKADEIVRALNGSRQSPDDLVEVSLYDCSTEATLEPYIEVRFNGVAPGKRLPITVSLPVTFKGVKLTIQGGSVVAVTAGECEIDGTVKLGDVTLAKLKEPLTITLRQWELPESPAGAHEV